MRGTWAHMLMQKAKIKYRTKFVTEPELIQGLADGEVDAAFISSTNYWWFLKNNPSISLGEFWLLDRDNKQLVVHQNKSGFVFVYNRGDGQIENIWPMNENYNWVKSINPKTGELIYVPNRNKIRFRASLSNGTHDADRKSVV